MADSSWLGFAEQLDGYSPALCNGNEYEMILESKAEDILSETATSVRICDLSGQGIEQPVFRSLLCETPEELRTYLNAGVQPDIRIISIFSGFTLDPLQISSSLLQFILAKYNVPLEFLDVLISFGDGPEDLEGSNSNVCRAHRSQSGSDLAYELKYHQRNGRSRAEPWSLRHTGVMHCRREDSHVFIVLQPVPDKESVFEKRLQRFQHLGSRGSQMLRELIDDPLRVHGLILTSYLPNWRPYLQFLGKDFSEKKNRALVTRFTSVVDAEKGFGRVRDLHGLHDTVSMAKACCKGNRTIVEALIADVSSQPLMDILKYQNQQLEGFTESLTSVQKRVENAIGLKGYAISLHGQVQSNQVGVEVASMTKEVRDLARSANTNSSFITIITILSGLYLPGSFVGTIFGSNFFSFNQQSRHISIASNFWIFIAAWLPLTALTILVFYAVILWEAWSNRRPFQSPWKKFKERRRGIKLETQGNQA